MFDEHYLELDEETLFQIERNDPVVTSLVLTASSWIEGAGPSIGANTVLQEIFVKANNPGEHDWFHELCHGLSRNRCLESFKLWLCGCNPELDIFHILTPFFMHNYNLRCIHVQYCSSQKFEYFVSALSKCKNTRVACLVIIQADITDEQGAVFFDLLHEMQHLSGLDFMHAGLGRSGCTALAKLLKNPTSKIRTLQIDHHYSFDDDCISILSEALVFNNTLDVVSLLGGGSDVTKAGWANFCAVLSLPTCSLKQLILSRTDIGDEEVICLGDALASNDTVKSLDLSGSQLITAGGWNGFSKCLRNPGSVLHELNLCECNIDEAGMLAIVSTLTDNSSLEALVMVDASKFTDRVWKALECALCDTSSIERTFSSNHTFHMLSLKDFASYDDIAPEIILFLEMNEFEDKAEVARQKILANHFIGEDIDIHAFQQMPESILPFAIEWIGSDEDGFALLNTIVRGFPSLLDINSMIHVQG